LLIWVLMMCMEYGELMTEIIAFQHNLLESDMQGRIFFYHLWSHSPYRANTKKILEFLRNQWAVNRKAEWSIWMVHTKVDMPHQYISSLVDASAYHGLHGRLAVPRKLTDDPAQAAAMRAELHRRSIAQMMVPDCNILAWIWGIKILQPSDAIMQLCSVDLQTDCGVVVMGHHLDLRLIRNQWLLLDPKTEFLMSEANEEKTSGDFRDMGRRLAQEVVSFVKRKWISCILAESIMEPYLRYLHTYLSVSGPHLGYLYSSNSLFNGGLWVLKKLKNTQCIHQLTFTDDPDLRNTFLYKLAKQKTLENFRNVILLSSPQDGYVPYHSARIEMCPASSGDHSKKGKVFLEMLNECLDQIRARSFEHRVFMRCDVNFDVSLQGKNLNTIIGRAAHIEFLETDYSVKKKVFYFGLEESNDEIGLILPPCFLPYPHPYLDPPPLSFPSKFRRHLPVLRRSLSVVSKAKTKELILGNPSVTVEKGKYSYDVETLINKLSSLPPRGSIARCLDAFKNKLSLSDFSHVFKEFAHRGDWQRSLRLFKYMQRQIWCKPNEHIYSLIIGILGREGLLDKSAEIFDEMVAHSVPRTVLSYTAIINAYGRNGQYEAAIELLDRMKTERILPNILTYNTVINACARGGYSWEGLLSLFGEMRHEGIQPDLVTYNTLLSACSNRGLGDEAEMVFRTMNESGVLPDITTYSYLVETFGKLGKLEKVSELLAEMEAGGNLPEIMSYNVLLEAYAHSGKIKEAMGVFRQMQAAVACLMLGRIVFC
ncbi:UNVERIFIED_CONTAM: Pentatricopeptide repeat-containing protein, chloroplastic, partial [Sesamum radiatum]